MPACPTLERGIKRATRSTILRKLMPLGLLRTRIPVVEGPLGFPAISLLATACLQSPLDERIPLRSKRLSLSLDATAAFSYRRADVPTDRRKPRGRSPLHSISFLSAAMPILPAEPDCNPPNLWDDPSIHSSNGEEVWWCLHTKPRQEKAVARDLRTQGAVYYLPQVLRETRTPKGRKIQSVVPLFISYIFLKGDLNARLAALRAHRLVNVLEVVDQQTLARDLHQIHTMLSSGLPVTTEDTPPVGATVRVHDRALDRHGR